MDVDEEDNDTAEPTEPTTGTKNEETTYQNDAHGSGKKYSTSNLLIHLIN